MADSYVTSNAVLRCCFGDQPSKLKVLPSRTVKLTEEPAANISDHIYKVNIPPFGKCHTLGFPPTKAATIANKGRLTPQPCIPNTMSKWQGGKNDYLIENQPALLRSSICRCAWGGIITIESDGQRNTGSPDMSREPSSQFKQM